MKESLRIIADRIIDRSIRAVLPDQAVLRALQGFHPSGRVFLVAAGKAAWQMAHAALQFPGIQITKGVVCTKYGHVNGPLPNIDCCEGGHPVPDENSYAATQKALDLGKNLREDDTVLFLLSGGGSALFESPLLPSQELQDITRQLLHSGASITEINTIRKRLSAVKGGRFALACRPASVFSIVLSDIVGDPLDMIASGPAVPDSSTCAQALAIANKYALRLSSAASTLLTQETPKSLSNVTTQITGSVSELCKAAAEACRAEGFEPLLISDHVEGEARDVGRSLGELACQHAQMPQKIALIMDGETTVHVTGSGLGGRNQELALSAAVPIASLPNVCVFSVGSDGTDGPTDAAGGYTDGNTVHALRSLGFSIPEVLKQNDAYHALAAINGLIKTGPTGTNVNDLSIALIDTLSPIGDFL